MTHRWETDLEVLNQALKGMLAGLGMGSGATRRGHGISCSATIQAGDTLLPPDVLRQLENFLDGSYLIASSKVVAIAEGRIISIPRRALLPRRNPDALRPVFEASALQQGLTVSNRDIIGADMLDFDEESIRFCLLPANPNRSAALLARKIRDEVDRCFDVVISDTSAGDFKGRVLVGRPTFFATPIGLTAGCDFFYGQRLSALAEVIRNESEMTPFVCVQPPTFRSLTRNGIGQFTYEGFCDSSREAAYVTSSFDDGIDP